MDTEELIRKCKAISIGEDKEKIVNFEGSMRSKGRQVVAGCLVGKILHNRSVNPEGLKSALHMVWRTTKEVRIESLGNNIFLFKFVLEADKKRILAGGPWHFDRALIILTEPTGIGEVTRQTFTHTSFWVQLRNVPIMCMEKDILKVLGEQIGTVEEVETDGNGECIGEIVRIRISVDITQPLPKLIFLKLEGEEKIPMPVGYEHLPDFCFCCGHIGHSFKECVQYKGQTKEQLPYGVWMKAIKISERAKLNRSRGNWNRNHGQTDGNPTSSEQTENGSSHQRRFEVNPNMMHGSKPANEETGQIIDQARDAEVEWKADEHLIQDIGGSGKKQIGDSKHEVASDKGKATKKSGFQAGKEKAKERENEGAISIGLDVGAAGSEH